MAWPLSKATRVFPVARPLARITHDGVRAFAQSAAMLTCPSSID